MDKVYCYPDTSILINRLDIHDKDKLLTAETSLVAVRLYQLYQIPIKGKFDYSHLCRIHHYIFQDLYDWAGKTRVVNIAKKACSAWFSLFLAMPRVSFQPITTIAQG